MGGRTLTTLQMLQRDIEKLMAKYSELEATTIGFKLPDQDHMIYVGYKGGSFTDALCLVKMLDVKLTEKVSRYVFR
jgi:hypothetical protein